MVTLGFNGLNMHYNLDTFLIKKPNSLSYKARYLLRMSLGSGGGRSVCLWRCRLLSVPLGEQASGRRWDCSGLDHVVRRCFGTKWYGQVPGARSTRDGDTGKYDYSSFAGFLKLTNMPMPSSVLPWQAAWQVFLISLKSSLRCAGRKNLEIRDPVKISIFCLTH